MGPRNVNICKGPRREKAALGDTKSHCNPLCHHSNQTRSSMWAKTPNVTLGDLLAISYLSGGRWLFVGMGTGTKFTKKFSDPEPVSAQCYKWKKNLGKTQNYRARSFRCMNVCVCEFWGKKGIDLKVLHQNKLSISFSMN